MTLGEDYQSDIQNIRSIGRLGEKEEEEMRMEMQGVSLISWDRSGYNNTANSNGDVGWIRAVQRC